MLIWLCECNERVEEIKGFSKKGKRNIEYPNNALVLFLEGQKISSWYEQKKQTKGEQRSLTQTDLDEPVSPPKIPAIFLLFSLSLKALASQ